MILDLLKTTYYYDVLMYDLGLLAICICMQALQP